MSDTEKKKTEPEDQEANRRKFIQKTARDMGVFSLAIYDLAKVIKTEIIQEISDSVTREINSVAREIKNAVERS